MADRPFSFGFAARETTRALIGLNIRGSAHLVDGFAEWFPLSVLLMGVDGGDLPPEPLARAVAVRHSQEARERALVRDLVRAWGVDTLAPFVLRDDKSYFFGEDESAFLAYRVVERRGRRLRRPDRPVGRVRTARRAFHRVRARARLAHRDPRRIGGVARALRAPRTARALPRRRGGRRDRDVLARRAGAIRKVRQSMHRLAARRLPLRVLRPARSTRSCRGELEAIARDWRGGEPERGFAMALDALFRGDDEASSWSATTRTAGRGLPAFRGRRSRARRSRSRRCRGCATRRTASTSGSSATRSSGRATHGFARVSLNFAPFAALLAPEAELSARSGSAARAPRAQGPFQLDNLLALQPEVLPGMAAPLRRLRAAPRPAARRARRARGRVVPAASGAGAVSVAAGLAAGARHRPSRSTAATSCSSASASKLPPLTLGGPPSLVSLFRNRRWTIGFFLGYRRLGALRRCPGARAAVARAGGLGGRDRRARIARAHARPGGSRSASRLSMCGLLLLGISLGGGAASRQRRARSLSSRSGSCARPPCRARRVSGPLLARGRPRRAAACCTRPGTSGRRPRSHGGVRLVFVPALLACHGLAFVSLQLGFQRGGPLATAGVATLLDELAADRRRLCRLRGVAARRRVRGAARARLRARRGRRGRARDSGNARVGGGGGRSAGMKACAFAAILAAGTLMTGSSQAVERQSWPLTRQIVIHYVAHDGVVRRADVLLPRLRRASRRAAAARDPAARPRDRCPRQRSPLGRPPGRDRFAVINPEGQGRRLAPIPGGSRPDRRPRADAGHPRGRAAVGARWTTAASMPSAGRWAGRRRSSSSPRPGCSPAPCRSTRRRTSLSATGSSRGSDTARGSSSSRATRWGDAVEPAPRLDRPQPARRRVADRALGRSARDLVEPVRPRRRRSGVAVGPVCTGESSG